MSEPGRAYGYRDAEPSHSQRYLNAPLSRIITARALPSGARALDYGCGNGWFANELAEKGFRVTGVDISASGVEVARRSFPRVQFSDDETLAGMEPFDLVTFIEVIAHCFRPAAELGRLFRSLVPGGVFILSTPYHGYWKNLAMAVTGKLEGHLDTSWEGAYVHYFHSTSIARLVEEAGFRNISITRAGRIPQLAKSMIVTCSKPA